MRFLFKVRLAVLTAVAFVVIGIAVPAPAPAIEVDGPAFSVVSIGRVVSRLAEGVVDVPPVTVPPVTVPEPPAVSMGPAHTIVCELLVEWPHKSSHVTGTVNVRGWWECTSPVSQLEINVDLWYRTNAAPAVVDTTTRKVASSGWKSNVGRSALETNAAQGYCLPGEYQGKTQGWVTFPPNHVPPSAFLTEQSIWRPINCL